MPWITCSWTSTEGFRLTVLRHAVPLRAPSHQYQNAFIAHCCTFLNSAQFVSRWTLRQNQRYLLVQQFEDTESGALVDFTWISQHKQYDTSTFYSINGHGDPLRCLFLEVKEYMWSECSTPLSPDLTTTAIKCRKRGTIELLPLSRS